MRIVLASMAPFVGGAEIAAERLALGLQGVGHAVLVILGMPGSVMERMEQAGLRCVYSSMCFTDKWHWLRYVRYRGRLQGVLRDFRPDVVHSNDLPTHQIVSDATRGLGVPVVCHHRYPFGGSAIDWLNKFGADRHLFVSQGLMEAMCRESSRLASSHRAVVHDGLVLPPKPTAEDRAYARSRLRLGGSRVLVTFAGQIIERKGVADLINAWSLLAPSVRDRAELVLIGDDLAEQGAYRVEMEALAAQLECPARFVGFQEDIGQWLTATDVAVVPSHVEPLGNATLEAMSYGLPVIGSAVGGIPEMVVHEQSGLLVPAKDPMRLAEAIARLIGAPELRERMGCEGRFRCEQDFGIETHVRSILGVYRDSIASRRGHSVLA